MSRWENTKTMENRKKLIRERFREDVFSRDNYRCRVCGNTFMLDAHHIINRNEMPYGGYVKENGISLCEDCHIRAEEEYFRDRTKLLVLSKYDISNLFNIIESSYEIALEACERLKDE